MPAHCEGVCIPKYGRGKTPCYGLKGWIDETTGRCENEKPRIFVANRFVDDLFSQIMSCRTGQERDLDYTVVHIFLNDFSINFKKVCILKIMAIEEIVKKHQAAEFKKRMKKK